MSLLVGPVILAAGGVLLGLIPGIVEGTLVAPAAAAVLAGPISVELVLWHGFNLALLLSAVTLLGGIAIYLEWINIHRATSWLNPLLRRGPERWYEVALAGMLRVAGWQTRRLQTGSLRTYVAATLAVTVAGVAATMIATDALPGLPDVTGVQPFEALLAGTMLAAAVFTAVTRHRLAAVAGLGVVGYGIAIVFILFSAPDLAKTQFLVEMLTVILFVLVFLHLPDYRKVSETSQRVRDAVIAGSVGVLMTLLVLAATSVRFHESISTFFAQMSYEGGLGRNVVNVILVDFRGVDTLGEIIVLGIAAIGVYALLKLKNDGRGDA